MSTWELMGTWLTDPSHLVAETGADLSMAIRKLKTHGFGSGSPTSALMLSLSLATLIIWKVSSFEVDVEEVLMSLLMVKELKFNVELK